MKVKKKRKIKSNKFIIIIVILILTLSSGYGLFSESITINGVVTADYLISGNELPLIIQENNEDGGVYSYGTYPTKSSNFSSEYVDNNYLYIYFDKYKTTTRTQKVVLNFKFNNPYPYELNSGNIEVTALSGSTDISSMTGRVVRETVNGYQENNRIKITFKYKNTSNYRSSIVQAKLSYNVDGITQYFYYVIEIS